MTEWDDAIREEWISKEALSRISKAEDIEVLAQLKVAFQIGKRSKQFVPVIIPPDCVKGLKILADKDLRKQLGINKNNKFLFPSTGLSINHVKGWNAFQNIAKGAQLEHHMTATKMRHRISTIYAGLVIPEEQRELFYSHMGHSKEINNKRS